MVKPHKLGKNTRMSFSKTDEVLQIPNLLDVQQKSYEWFINEGMREVLRDVSPITDFSGNLVIEFVDFTIDETPKYPVEECKERDVNYAAPMHVRVRLTNKATGEVKEEPVYMSDFPIMTDNGTFVINGAERVVVSQIVRSPGVYYESAIDKSSKRTYAATVIPYRGAWLEYETDANDVFYVRIDKNRKMLVTILIRALGIETDSEIKACFGDDPRLTATLEKDNLPELAKEAGTTIRDEALKEIYKKLRPGEPPLVESAKTLINNLFFDPKRYDLANVGRYKYNRKLGVGERIKGRISSRKIINPVTGELIFDENTYIDAEKAATVERAGVNEVYVRMGDGQEMKVLGNGTVRAEDVLGFSLESVGITEKVRVSVLLDILSHCDSEDEIKAEAAQRSAELVPKHITVEDIFASINYMLCLANGLGSTDDIDHLGNRRLRSVGELLQNQVRIGFSRMDKIIKERMTCLPRVLSTPVPLSRR